MRDAADERQSGVGHLRRFASSFASICGFLSFPAVRPTERGRQRRISRSRSRRRRSSTRTPARRSHWSWSLRIQWSRGRRWRWPSRCASACSDRPARPTSRAGWRRRRWAQRWQRRAAGGPVHHPGHQGRRRRRLQLCDAAGGLAGLRGPAARRGQDCQSRWRSGPGGAGCTDLGTRAGHVERTGVSLEERGSRKIIQISRFFARQPENWRAIGITLSGGSGVSPRQVRTPGTARRRFDHPAQQRPRYVPIGGDPRATVVQAAAATDLH